MTYFLLYDTQNDCSIRTTSEKVVKKLTDNLNIKFLVQLNGFDMKAINAKESKNYTSRKYLKLIKGLK